MSNVRVYEPEDVLKQAQENVAIASPAQLKAWMNATGRRYVVLIADDLIDALPWPGGVEAMTQIVECYRQHRATVAAEDRPCPECNGECDGPGSCRTCNGAGIERRFKTDVLEPEEMKLAVKWLLEQIHETEPEWRPDA